MQPGSAHSTKDQRQGETLIGILKRNKIQKGAYLFNICVHVQYICMLLFDYEDFQPVIIILLNLRLYNRQRIQIFFIR